MINLRSRTVRSAITPDVAGPLLSAPAEHPLLTAEEERVLGRQVQAGRDAATALARRRRIPPRMRRAWQDAVEDGRRARDALALANVRLAWYVAQRYDGADVVPLADLVGEALIGLLIAADRYDPNRGVRYATYALHWVRKYVSAAVQRGRYRTPVPFSAIDAGEARAARAESPRRAAVAGPPDPLLDAVIERSIREDLVTLLAQADLDALEQRIIIWRYALDAQGERTPGEIARQLGMPPAHIRAVEHTALAKLRAAAHRLGVGSPMPDGSA